jgi:predicted ester cyclase
MKTQHANPDTESTSGIPSPEAVVRRLIDEGFSLGRLEVADELVAAGCLEHQNFGPNHPPGPDGVRAVIASLHRAFSDYRLSIEALCAQGDLVWTRNVATGTNDGSFFGYAPTGRPMRVTVFDVMRVAGGKIVEHWGVPDRLGVLVQLGVLPTPEAPLSSTFSAMGLL